MRDFQKLWNEKPWWPEGTTDKEMAEFYYKKGLEAQTEPVAEVPCSAGLSDHIDSMAEAHGEKIRKKVQGQTPIGTREMVKTAATESFREGYLRAALELIEKGR